MSTIDTDTADAEGPATPARVYADPHTDLFHRRERQAGADAIPFSRPQADVFGFRPCPDCFNSRRGEL